MESSVSAPASFSHGSAPSRWPPRSDEGGKLPGVEWSVSQQRKVDDTGAEREGLRTGAKKESPVAQALAGLLQMTGSSIRRQHERSCFTVGLADHTLEELPGAGREVEDGFGPARQDPGPLFEVPR